MTDAPAVPAKKKRNRRIKSRSLHGLSTTPTYTVWKNMCTRTENENDPGYARYGGRGISVCERWRQSFEAFLEDMGEKPEGMSIDRYPDNDGNYEPGNCRWATSRQQVLNRRNTLMLTHEGETLSLVEWCERLAIRFPPAVKKLKAGVESSLVLDPAYRLPKKRPAVIRSSRMIEFDGRSQSMSAWAREIGITREALRQRLLHGWPIENALTSPPGCSPPDRKRGRPATSNTKRIELNGESRTLGEWASHLGLKREGLSQRLKHLPLEQALTKPRYVHTSKLKSPT